MQAQRRRLAGRRRGRGKCGAAGYNTAALVRRGCRQRDYAGNGAEVLLGAKVTNITAFGIHYDLAEKQADGSIKMVSHFLPTRTVVWAAGVAASPLGKALAKGERALVVTPLRAATNGDAGSCLLLPGGGVVGTNPGPEVLKAAMGK